MIRLYQSTWIQFQKLKDAFYLEDSEKFLKVMNYLGKIEDFFRFKVEDGWIPTNGKKPAEISEQSYMVKLRDERVLLRAAGHPFRWTDTGVSSDILYYQVYDATKLALLKPFHTAFVNENQKEFDEAWRNFLALFRFEEEGDWILYTPIDGAICPIGSYDTIRVRYRDGKIESSVKPAVLGWDLNSNSKYTRDPATGTTIIKYNPIEAFKFVEKSRDRSR